VSSIDSICCLELTSSSEARACETLALRTGIKAIAGRDTCGGAPGVTPSDYFDQNAQNAPWSISLQAKAARPQIRALPDPHKLFW
jgi:hypothetical protein